MVSPRETDLICYEATLAQSRRTGKLKQARTLLTRGPPTYSNALNAELALSHEYAICPHDPSFNAEGADGF
ncbi:MAG: hypothetical protein ACKVVP_12505 [Chloroflexota bacterium]